ncbi:MAG: patatin-like phospholipase family protein [Candidatus Omnitrophica bacterium]|nr:patatin-like phospholipase family protein [Candidatus Omnitrophota bacterium]
MEKNPVKIALALGGGGVRGLAHIGIIKSLQKDIPLSMIAGTSMGAMVGAYYALHAEVATLEKKIIKIIEKKDIKEIERIIGSDNPGGEKKLIAQTLLTLVKRIYLLNLRAIKRWVFSGKEIYWVFDELGLNVDFNQVKIPFCCMSVDLRTGDDIMLNEGNIKEAILASTALPGVFPPLKKGNRLLIDGGITGSVPVAAAKSMAADIVIAVGVEARVDYNKILGNGLDMMFQADAIRADKLTGLRMKEADVQIYPEVWHISWASFSRARECIKAGEEAAEKAKPQIFELIRKKRREKAWRKIFSLGWGAKKG